MAVFNRIHDGFVFLGHGNQIDGREVFQDHPRADFEGQRVPDPQPAVQAGVAETDSRGRLGAKIARRESKKLKG